MVFGNPHHPRTSEEGMMNNVMGLTLRARDGREQRTLAWLPTEEIRREFYERARRNGLEIIEDEPEQTERI